MKFMVYATLRWMFLLAALVILTAGAALANASPYDVNLVTAFHDVAQKAIPSVVHIEVTEKQSVVNPLLPFQNDPFFRYFFGNPGTVPKTFEREIQGLGSGILIDAQGHILTNSHVVNGATKMTVVLSDGRRYTGISIRVIGVDSKTDLGVVQIKDKESFPSAVFGDSDKIDVGQWVVAIGHPQGLDQTVTHGIISAKHRRGITDPSSYQDFLQTDAAIISESGGFEGIGFAIPGNLALRVARQLISSGKVQRGYLGLTIQNLTPELVRSFGVSEADGVLVANVFKDGPAEKAGIKRGDIIAAFQGKPVGSLDAFRNEVAAAPIGQTVLLTILRGGRSREIDLRVSSDEELGKALMSSVTERFGIEVKPVAKTDAKKYGLNEGNGVVVSRVEAKGPFVQAGIEPGDIILQINRKTVAGPDELGEVLSTTPPKTNMILTVIDHRSRDASIVQISAP